MSIVDERRCVRHGYSYTAIRNKFKNVDVPSVVRGRQIEKIREKYLVKRHEFRDRYKRNVPATAASPVAP